MTLAGLPHSEIPGSKRACRSPRHIAACHVFHRLSVPRHPPSTLSNLTIKCLDLMRSAASDTHPKTSIVVHLSTYPYSIVNELRIAKIDAAHKPLLRLQSPLILAVAFSLRCQRLGSWITRSAAGHFRLRLRLVELDGIEPTTLCLQSRCSPN